MNPLYDHKGKHGHKEPGSRRASESVPSRQPWNRDLRLALVDPDDGTHATVRQMISISTPARRWGLDSYQDAGAALGGILSSRPHVVLMEFSLPGVSGIECAQRLKALVPDLPIVMFTARNESEQILLSLLGGLSGYLVKPAQPRNFFSVVHRAARGSLAFCEEAERVLKDWLGGLATRSQFEALTPRERVLLPSILQGLSNKEISGRVGGSCETIHGHRTRLYKKFGVHSREGLLRTFLGIDALCG